MCTYVCADAAREGKDFKSLLAYQVFDVLVVFLADVFDQLALKQRRMRRERPRLREGLWVVNDVHNLEVTKVCACEALGYFHVGRVWNTRLVEPRDVVLANRFDDQRVASPVTDRVAEPCQ